MDALGCKLMDSRDANGRERFLPLRLESHLLLGVTDDDTWFWEIHPSFYRIQKVEAVLVQFFNLTVSTVL